MRLKVGFSFPPMSTSIRPVMQGIVEFAQFSSHCTPPKCLAIVAVWKPKRDPTDTLVCQILHLSTHLSVAPEGEGVLLLPGLPAASGGVVVLVATVDTTGLLAGGGKTTSLTVLVHRVDDPVDAGITADGLVLGVDKDDLVVLVGGVLVDPVGVEDAEVGAAAADTLLSGGLEGALVLELVDTLVGGLACSESVSCSGLIPISASAYRRWHPWGQGACDHHDGRGHGR